MKEIPEDGRLVAHHTGDGWALSVETRGGETIAYLEWPEQWPETLKASQLKEYGFEVV